MSDGGTVLVTGGSGYIGGWCAIGLLQQGYNVRATVRDLSREPTVRANLAKVVDPGNRLSFYAANLTEDAGWDAAVDGCDYVLHVASPLGVAEPKDPNELIIPARDGAKRAVGAAIKAGVKRVVMTSSVAATSKGGPGDNVSDETDWTDPSANVSAYVKSKTLAERAAWEFIAREGGGLELSVVNPVLVLGPVLGPDLSTSIALIKRMLDGGMPGCLRLSLGVVDVRDVVDLHLRAMTSPAAKGERFLATAGDFLSMLEMSMILRNRMGASAEKSPTREMPNWFVRLLALPFRELRQTLPELGKPKNATNEKAKRILGWTPRSNEECIVATAESLVRLGLLKNRSSR